MAKRQSSRDSESPHSKRRRLTQALEAQPTEQKEPDVVAAQDLHALFLVQESTANLLSNLRIFQRFLRSISSLEDVSKSAERKKILLDYLKSQHRIPSDAEPYIESDLLLIWHHARSIRFENLISSAAETLRILLQTISRHLEFQDLGSAFCNTLLQAENITLLEHGLKARKSREYMVIPSLGLLQEIVNFDGGKSAKHVFRLRDITFQRLEYFLTGGNTTKEDDALDQQSSAIRESAIQYLISNIALQGPSGRNHILIQYKWFRALLRNLRQDSPRVVLRVLSTFSSDVLKSRDVPLGIKLRFFNETTLSQIAHLYLYKRKGPGDTEAAAVRSQAHELLCSICVGPQFGLLTIPGARINFDEYHTERFLPSSVKIDHEDGNLGSNERYSSYKTVLALLLSLRPQKEPKQISLLLSCFKAAPRLQDDYFKLQTRFEFEPVLNFSWIGQSHFMLAVIQEGFDKDFIDNHRRNGGSSIDQITNAILPPPLTKEKLSRCINHKSQLVNFITLRILRSALKKLLHLQAMIHTWTREKNALDSEVLQSEIGSAKTLICQRCPTASLLIQHMKKLPPEPSLHFECLLSVLNLYHEVSLEMATDNKFDLSSLLPDALAQWGSAKDSGLQRGLYLLQLKQCVELALRSPHTHWWRQPGSEALSNFTALIRVLLSHEDGKLLQSMSLSLKALLEDHFIFWPSKSFDSWTTFLLSLQSMRGNSRESDVYLFIDNCFRRLMSRVIIYSDSLEDAMNGNGSQSSSLIKKPDLLLLVVLDQLPHAFERNEASLSAAISDWSRHYFHLLAQENELTIPVQKLCTTMIAEGDQQKYRLAWSDISECSTKNTESHSSLEVRLDENNSTLPQNGVVKENSETLDPLNFAALAPEDEDESHRGLTRWLREDIVDAIKDGHVGNLIQALCSKHQEIRLQALSGLHSARARLEKSTYEEGMQARLLLGELIETAKDQLSIRQPASVLAAVAKNLLLVIDNPRHHLYTKVNEFLNRGPTWDLERLPAYWTSQILYQTPEHNENFNNDLLWLLDTLLEGLQTNEDFNSYWRCDIFQRLLTMVVSPHVTADCIDKALDILARCTFVDGSTTLITRCGIMAWLRLMTGMEQLGSHSQRKVQALLQRIHETRNHEKITQWIGVGSQTREGEVIDPGEN